ncbi:hypothetical protein Glove_476g40 [Diversispora epigaea]|uniref:Uncharacterized protein n=1 Tax=Diversispora epigaea TaxID=1348612 RepID=A0A397GKR5_9GLOM|nr:hypothetical protein Glove_476g40 [Diversispora epigaea]
MTLSAAKDKLDEYGPKLILDILDGKRPEITDDKISKLPGELKYFVADSANSEDFIKKYRPYYYYIWPGINKDDLK